MTWSRPAGAGSVTDAAREGRYPRAAAKAPGSAWTRLTIMVPYSLGPGNEKAKWEPAAVKAPARSRQPVLALVSVRTSTCSGRPASHASWRCARCSEGLPMLKVRKDRPLVAMSAPVGVQGYDTVGDYSRDVTGRAGSGVNAVNGPAEGGEPGGGVVVQSRFGGGTVWLALESAVRAAAPGQPAGEDCWGGVQDDGQVGGFRAVVELPDRVPAHAVHALQDQAGRHVPVTDDGDSRLQQR